MNTPSRVFGARSLPALVIAGSLFAAQAQANDHRVIVSRQVDSTGLDLNNSADAAAFYMRLRHAAVDVCERRMRVDLLPNSDATGCFEKALGDAVRQAHATLVTQQYLSNHTLRQAAQWGIQIPSEVASR